MFDIEHTSRMQKQDQEPATMDHKEQGLAPPSNNSSTDAIWASPNPYGEANTATERGTSALVSDAPATGAASDTNFEQDGTAQQNVPSLARRKSGRKCKPSHKFDALDEKRSPPGNADDSSALRVERRPSKRTDQRALSSDSSTRCGKQRQRQSSLKAKDDRWCWEEEELILLEWAAHRRTFTSWIKIGHLLGRTDQASRIRHCHLTKPCAKERAAKALHMRPPKILPAEVLARLASVQIEGSVQPHVLTASQVQTSSPEQGIDQAHSSIPSPSSHQSETTDIDMDTHSNPSSTSRYATPYYGTQDFTIIKHFICHGCKYSRPTQRQRLAADDICTYCDLGISDRGRDSEELAVCVTCGGMGSLACFIVPNGPVTHPGHYHRDTCTECQRIKIETPIHEAGNATATATATATAVVADMEEGDKAEEEMLEAWEPRRRCD